MGSPPLEQPFDHMAARSFSFFPAIVGLEHNEWDLRQVNWSEVLVANRGTGLELWVPRRFFGQASAVEDPVLIVGLTRELEYAGGMLRPFKQRLVRMPAAPTPPHVGPQAEGESVSHMMHVRAETSDKRALRLDRPMATLSLRFSSP